MLDEKILTEEELHQTFRVAREATFVH
jgi:hypothetical protein